MCRGRSVGSPGLLASRVVWEGRGGAASGSNLHQGLGLVDYDLPLDSHPHSPSRYFGTFILSHLTRIGVQTVQDLVQLCLQ